MARKSTKAVEAVEEVKVEEPVVETVESVEPETKSGIVSNCARVNVRKEANPDAEVVTVLNKDTKVEILGEKGKFYQVTNGYIMKDFVTIV